MKRMSLFLLSLFLVSCASAGSVQPEKAEFKEVELNGKQYFFRYPADATVHSEYILKDGCKIMYGQGFEDLGDSFEKNDKEKDGKQYAAWYSDSLIVGYKAWLPELAYGFYVSDVDNGVEDCMDLVDQLGDSFSDQLDYVNYKFSFALALPSDYEVEYQEDGLVLTKWMDKDSEFDPEDPEDRLAAYKVEIVVMPFENYKDYPDLGAFVAGEYSGFSIEFVDYEKVSGYYVDEGQGTHAVRHFFAMDGGVIYEAYLRLPSFHFPKHEGEFENVVKSLEIF